MRIVPSSRPHISEYHLASSVDGALAFLMAHHGRAQVIAGGTALMLDLQREQTAATHLVDVSRIHTMKAISEQNDHLLIGGAVTFTEIAASELVRRCAPLVYTSSRLIGTPQVRFLATLAGGLVWAMGNAEGSAALVALDAEAEITNFTGPQWLPVASLFVHSGLSRVDSTSEVVTALRMPLPQLGQGSALARLAPTETLAGSALVLALVLALDGEGRSVEWASLVIGSPQMVPRHLPVAEQALCGEIAENGHPHGALLSLAEGGSLAESTLLQSPPVTAERLASLAVKAYDRALAMAQKGLKENPSPL